MTLSTAPYLVQRQDEGGVWAPVLQCNSLEYAEMIAASGLREQIGASYRAIDVRTGESISLAPDLQLVAAEDGR